MSAVIHRRRSSTQAMRFHMRRYLLSFYARPLQSFGWTFVLEGRKTHLAPPSQAPPGGPVTNCPYVVWVTAWNRRGRTERSSGGLRAFYRVGSPGSVTTLTGLQHSESRAGGVCNPAANFSFCFITVPCSPPSVGGFLRTSLCPRVFFLCVTLFKLDAHHAVSTLCHRVI